MCSPVFLPFLLRLFFSPVLLFIVIPHSVFYPRFFISHFYFSEVELTWYIFFVDLVDLRGLQ